MQANSCQCQIMLPKQGVAMGVGQAREKRLCEEHKIENR